GSGRLPSQGRGRAPEPAGDRPGHLAEARRVVPGRTRPPAPEASRRVAFAAVPIPELLERLLEAVGPSAHETAPAKVWRDGCRDFASEIGADLVGASYARVPGTAGGPTLALIGHIDEIGVHVTHVEDSGYLRFGQVGGWDPVVLIGQRVRVSTRTGALPGVIARKPI